MTGSRTTLRLDELAYELAPRRADVPEPTPVAPPLSFKSAFREAIDWETVTPLDELPSDTLAARVKKGLRWWRQPQAQGVET